MRAVWNTLVLAGIVVVVLGKIVGVAYAVRSENSSNVPFIVLVASGYLMVIGGGLAGGSLSF